MLDKMSRFHNKYNYSSSIESDARSHNISTLTMTACLGSIYLSTLEAYNLFGIPVTWISGCIFPVSWILSTRDWPAGTRPTGRSLLFAYLAICLIALVFQNIFSGAPKMPRLTENSYIQYITLRIINIFIYVSALSTGYMISEAGGYTRSMKILTTTLMVVSISSIYIYIAQKYGLWEPPRNRAGTGGQDYLSEAVAFSYSFFRALGTFREPSHLAEWLSATLLLLLPQARSMVSRLRYVTMVTLAFSTMVLTGSLLGFMGLMAGAIYIVFAKRNYMVFVHAVLALIFSVLFTLTVEWLFDIDLLGALLPRIDELAYGGIGETNRSAIYEYFWSYPPPISGQGLGNGALIFSQYSGTDLISPIINLFMTSWYDGGVLGLLLMIMFFVLPFRATMNGAISRHPLVIGGLASHVSFIVSYFGRAAELNPVHGVYIGLVMGFAFGNARPGTDRRG